MLFPADNSIHQMYNHFARRTYEHFYAQFRCQVRIHGYAFATRYYLTMKHDYMKQNKMPHIMKALDNAFLSIRSPYDKEN